MADDAHDLGYKMSKKIAQLTKVIYQLNCRNEDNDATIRTVADRYETEIAEIMADARGKITSLKEQLDAQNDTAKIDIVVKDLTMRHQREKEEATRLFDEFKSTAIRNEATARQRFEERLIAAGREVTAAKDQFATAIEELRAQSLKNASSDQLALEELRKRKDKEMDDLVKEYNERYKAMMAEQMDAQDRMERELIAEWQGKLDAERSAHDTTRAQLQQQLGERDAAVKTARMELEASQAEAKRLTGTVQVLEEEMARLRQRELALNSGSAELGAELEKSNDLIASLKAKVARQDEHATGLDATVTSLRSDIDQHLRTISRQVSEMETLANEISILKAAIAKGQADLDAEARRRGELSQSSDTQVRALEGRLTDAEAAYKQAQRKMDACMAELSALKSAHAALQAELAKERERFAHERRQMEEAHAKALLSAAQNADSSSSSLVASHQAELERLRAAQAKAMAEAEQMRIDALEKCKHGYEAMMGTREAEHEGASQKAAQSHADSMRKLQEELDALRVRMEGDSSATDAALADLQAQLEQSHEALLGARSSHAAEMSALREAHSAELADAISKASASAGEYGAVRQRLEAEIAQLKADAISAEGAHKARLQAALEESEQTIASLKRQHAAEVEAALRSQSSDVTARHQAEMGALRQEMASKLEAQRISLEGQMASRVRELTDQMRLVEETSSRRIASLEAELLSARSESSADQEGHAKTLAALHEAMAALKAQHISQLAAEKKRMAAEHALALAALSEGSAARLKAAIDELAAAREAHASELSRIVAEGKATQEELERRHASLLRSLESRKDEERNTAVCHLKESLENAMAAQAAKDAEAIEALRIANGKLGTEISALSSSLGTINKQLDATAAELMQKSRMVEEGADEMARMTKAHSAALAELKRALEADRNQAIATVHRQHQEDSERALAAFEAERSDFAGKIKQLKRHIADLEYKYANRESRAEDVEKINSLLRELREKDEALLKAYNDMKFYKLELVNREESYNKVFGRQPTIATADSTKPVAPSSAPPAKAAGADGPRPRLKSLK